MAQTKVQLLMPNLGDVIDFDSSTLFMDGADNRVGIRNTNPQYELDVTGTVRATNFIGSGDTTIADWIIHDGDTNTKFGFPANDKISFHTNGSERLHINTIGYLGINDSGPNARLTVRGDSDTSDADCQIRIYDTDSTAGSQIPSVSFWGGSTEIGRIRGTDTAGMRFYTANSGTLGDRMSIGADGNVHINTDDNSTANAKLNIENSTNNSSIVLKLINKPSSANGKARLEFYTETSSGQGCSPYIQSVSGTDAGGSNSNNDGGLEFHTKSGGSGTDINAISIRADGKVGINKTAPAERLEVGGGVKLEGDIYSSNNNPWIYSSNGGSGVRAGINLDGTNQRLDFSTGGSSNVRLRIHSGGKFSYGTTSDGYGQWSFVNIGSSGGDATGGETGLTIRSDEGFTNTDVTGSDNWTLKIRNNAYAGSGVSGNQGTVSKILFSAVTSNGHNSAVNIGCDTRGTGANKGDFFVVTGGSERLRITQAGKVGIGCDPDYTLDVRAASGDVWVSARGGTNQGFQVRKADNTLRGYAGNGAGVNLGADDFALSAPAANLVFQTGGTAASNERVRITSGGDINIHNRTAASTTDPVTVDFGGQYTADASITHANLKVKLFSNSANNDSGGFTMGQSGVSYVSSVGAAHIFYTAPSAVNGLSERFRFTHNGKIGFNYAATPPSEDVMICTAGQASPAGVTLSHLAGGNRYGARFQTISGASQGICIDRLFNSTYSEALRIKHDGDIDFTSTTGNATFTFKKGDSPSGQETVYARFDRNGTVIGGVGGASMLTGGESGNNMMLANVNNGHVVFGTGTGGSASPRMRIRNDGHVIIDTPNNGYSGLKIYDDTGGDYNIRYIAGRNQSATAHIFMDGGRNQNATPWVDATPNEAVRLTRGKGISFKGVTSTWIGLDGSANRIKIQTEDKDAVYITQSQALVAAKMQPKVIQWSGLNSRYWNNEAVKQFVITYYTGASGSTYHVCRMISQTDWGFDNIEFKIGKYQYNPAGDDLFSRRFTTYYSSHSNQLINYNQQGSGTGTGAWGVMDWRQDFGPSGSHTIHQQANGGYYRDCYGSDVYVSLGSYTGIRVFVTVWASAGLYDTGNYATAYDFYPANFQGTASQTNADNWGGPRGTWFNTSANGTGTGSNPGVFDFNTGDSYGQTSTT